MISGSQANRSVVVKCISASLLLMDVYGSSEINLVKECFALCMVTKALYLTLEVEQMGNQ